MILTIGIIGLLILSFFHGRQRGLLQMGLSLVSYVIAWIAAKELTQTFGAWLVSTLPAINFGSQTTNSVVNGNLGNYFFYHGVAFLFVFTVVLALCRWLARRLNLITKLPVIHQANALGGGLISVVLTYLIIFLVLTVFQGWPGDWWQDQLTASSIAQWMINNTPLLSQQLTDWFSNQ